MPQAGGEKGGPLPPPLNKQAPYGLIYDELGQYFTSGMDTLSAQMRSLEKNGRIFLPGSPVARPRRERRGGFADRQYPREVF